MNFVKKVLKFPLQSIKPWQKYAPSPMDASPSGGILKRPEKSNVDADPEPEQAANNKVRRVHFPDPPVSDQVYLFGQNSVFVNCLIKL
jgi:hypothetical protein